MNPEIKINRLYLSVMELLNTTSSFLQEETMEEEENLRKILRKIIISKTLYEKNVIAVTGLQGVGKSTIIKNFYELDDSALPIVAGRGERLPILVTEFPIEKPEAYAIITRKNEQSVWSTDEVNINWEDFKRYARGEDMSAMILGVRVPYKYFNNNYTSFLILPGFEGTGEDYWETLIEYSLTCSNTVVFAVNEAKMADRQNKERIGKVLEEFKGTNPIFTLTFGDQSKDNNMQLKNTLLVDYGIEETDRIISVGAYDSERNKLWAKELVYAVAKYSSISQDYRAKQLKQLNSLIRRDLLRTAKKIKEELSFEGNSYHRRIDKILDVFDIEQEKLKKSYEKSLRKSFNELEHETSDRIRLTVKNTKLGYKLKGALLDKSNDDYIRLNKNLDNLLYPEEDSLKMKNLFQIRNENASINMLSERLGIVYEESGEYKRIQGVDGRFDIVNVDNPETAMKKSYIMKPENAHDLSIICIEDKGIELLKSKDLSESIRLIPAVASVNLAMYYSQIGVDKKNVDLLDDTHQFRDWGTIQKAPENILRGFAATAGISLMDLADGRADIIGGISKGLGLGVSKTAAVALTGGIATVALAVGILKEINQNNTADANQYSIAFKVIRMNFENDYLEKYDDYMASIRERLHFRLMDMFGIRVLDSRVDNLLLSLAKVESRVTEMEELINAASC